MIKRHCVFIRLLSLVTALTLTFSCSQIFAENDNEQQSVSSESSSDDRTNQSALFLKKGSYASAEEMLRDMTVAAESEGKVLYYINDTADIAVLDKKSGKIWLSSPFDYKNDPKASDEIKINMASFIRVIYYDNQSNMFEMNSYEDCIAKNQFKIEKIENGIRVDMRIGKDEDQLSLPFAIEDKKFEEKIVPKLSGIAKRRVEAFYTKYSLSDDSIDKAVRDRLSKLYPGLSDHDFYILRDDASDRDKQLLTEYIADTDYSLEDYRDDLSKSGSTDEANAQALIKLSVEIALINGDLSVRIPSDKISYDKESFVLNKIRAFEYFGAGKTLNGGYLFIPDGSGGIINFNRDSSKKILNISCSVYGKDHALLQNEEYQNIAQQSYMPVYGIKEADKAFIAVIEDGDAMAQIVSESGNIVSGYETVYAEFDYSSVQTYLYNDSQKQNGQWTYYSKKYFDGSFILRYRFLTGDSADYVGMAKSYRNYLIENGTIERAESADYIPIYLETVGQITRKNTFLGVPYNKKIDITSFSDAVKIMEELKDNGVKNITLRYKGWMNGGLNSTVASKVSVEKKLGGIKGFKDLNSYIKDNGFKLFPEVSFQIVRHNKLFDGFAPIFDSPRSNDDRIAYVTPPEELNNISKKQNQYAAVSPSKISRYFEKYFKKYKATGAETAAILYAGNMLYSDFSKDNGVTRQESMKILAESIKKYAAAGSKIMADGGNAYIYPYTSDILGMPCSNGGNITEDESIPFMQIALHGYIRYSGAAINLSDNWKTEILKAAEYGSNLYFTVGYKNTEYLKDTTMSYLYSVDYSTWKNDITDYYNKFNKIFASLQSLEITDHKMCADGVYKTTYEDGTAVIVNYGNASVTIDGVTVAAMDFAVA